MQRRAEWGSVLQPSPVAFGESPGGGHTPTWKAPPPEGDEAAAFLGEGAWPSAGALGLGLGLCSRRRWAQSYISELG